MFSYWIGQYNRDRSRIEKDLAVIRDAVDQRTQDAIKRVVEQRDILVDRIDEHIDQEQTVNRYETHIYFEYSSIYDLILSIKHNELANEFRQIQNRFDSALKYDEIYRKICFFEISLFSGEDIGSYTQDDFLRDIRDLQTRMNKRSDIIETHILKVNHKLLSTSSFLPLCIQDSNN